MRILDAVYRRGWQGGKIGNLVEVVKLGRQALKYHLRSCLTGINYKAAVARQKPARV